MSACDQSRAHRPISRWQFSLGTLLIAMTGAALTLIALRNPNELWGGIIFVAAAGSLLVAALVIVYRTGRTRAFAVGFLIFGAAYWWISFNDTPEYIGSSQPRLPTTRWAITLFSLLHNDQMQVQTQVLTAAVPVPTSTLVPASANFVEVRVAGAPPAYPVTPLVAQPPAVGVTAAPPPMKIVSTTIQQGSASLVSFLEVAHRSLAILLGVIGGIIAQILYSTHREEQPGGPAGPAAP